MEKSATTSRCVWLAVIFTLMSGVVGDCRINIEALDKSHAMFVKEGGSDIIYPNADGEVIITKYGTRLMLECPKTYTTNRLDNYLMLEQAINPLVKCDNDGTLIYDNGLRHQTKEPNHGNFTCYRIPIALMREVGSCLDNKNLYRVRFEWAKYSYFTLYEVCAEKEKVHYVKQTLVKERLLAHESYGGDESFKPDPIFTGDLKQNQPWKYCNKSVESITSQLGNDKKLYENLFGIGGFITPGQLAGRGDFCYRAEQQSTYYVSNYQPQWNKLKNQNWAVLEKSIREMAKARDKWDPVDVYTGTFGQLRAIRDGRNSRNESVALTLDDNAPIPAIFWKVVYDNRRRKGVAFIGHNSIANEFNNITCNDESGRIEWLTRKDLTDFKDEKRGTIFVCSIRSFLSVVKIELPQDVRVGEIL